MTKHKEMPNYLQQTQETMFHNHNRSALAKLNYQLICIIFIPYNTSIRTTVPIEDSPRAQNSGLYYPQRNWSERWILPVSVCLFIILCQNLQSQNA